MKTFDANEVLAAISRENEEFSSLIVKSGHNKPFLKLIYFAGAVCAARNLLQAEDKASEDLVLKLTSAVAETGSVLMAEIAEELKK